MSIQHTIIDTIPGDKSISHRAIILGSIANGTTHLSNFLFSEDCLNTLKIFQSLGADITYNTSEKTVTIKGKGLKNLSAPNHVLDVGNSGTSIRLISGLLAGLPFTSEISGDSSIQSRPMKRIIDPLCQMGARISGQHKPESTDIYPKLTITGTRLHGIQYTLPVASAQVKSAILLAALTQSDRVTVIEPEICRNHSEVMLAQFGADIQVKSEKNGNIITCSGKKELKPPTQETLQIPSDISSAAFFIVLGVIKPHSQFTLKNIGLNPTRNGVITLLQKMGADIQITPYTGPCLEPYGDITVKSTPLKNISVPESLIANIIDEIPILAIAACAAEGTFTIKNAKELRVKESDRITQIVRLIRSMGGQIIETEDGFQIEGNRPLQNFSFGQFNHDHRMAMSALIAAKAFHLQATISDTQCIQTSFPNFMEILKKI